jgi:Secretion system C-terminal sorting domain
VIIAAAAPPNTCNLEYFIDNDPGFGNGTPIAVTPNTNLQLTNVPITIPSNLSIGIHNFHIRSKQNPWSIDNAKTFNVGGVVPNTWSYITAKLQDAQTLISWGTEQEINSLKFDVERSVNGIQFIKIGEQQAAGNSSTLINYNFIDTKPETGFNYYRVKQIDVDGSVHYSAIVKVLYTQNIKEAFIAPNPVVDVINLVEPIAVNINSIEIFDSRGAVVLRKNINSKVQLYSLQVATLSKGNYVVKINYEKSTKSLVFVK